MINRIGRYEIRSRLGSGAFATVFEAFDPRLESTVAIKLLADNWIHEPDVRARFRQEAVLLRRVQTAHPTAPLLDVYDIDETEDGRPYFVMRMADRGSLAERTSPGQKWAPPAIEPVVTMLEQALGTLHQAGIVHRDVKPSNLLISASAGAPQSDAATLIAPTERLLLGDLGLAKDQLISGSALTMAGGTPKFMAPEQRDPAAPVDHRADLFAATVVIVDLLTGSPDEPGDNSGLSHEARALLRIGMATEPTDRFSDSSTWADAMRRVLCPTSPEQATTAPGPTAAGTPAPPAASHSEAASVRAAVASSPFRELGVRVAAAGFAVLVLLAAIAFALTRSGDGAIVGPRDASVGDEIVLSANVDPGDRYVWSVGGREVNDQDLTIGSDRVGFVDVELVVTSEDGTVERSTTRVEISR